MSRWRANLVNVASKPLLIVLIAEAEKLCPQSSSAIALTLRVDTPCTYISARAATNAFSRHWKRSKSAVENSPLRSRGTRKLNLADAPDQPPAVIACAVSGAGLSTLPAARPQKLRHLGLKNLVQRFLGLSLEQVSVLCHQHF